MMRLVYSALWHLLIPIILIRLIWRGQRLPAYRKRIAERFGFGSVQPVPGVLWIHTVSVGEFQAAIPLIRQLMVEWPERRLLITTMTPTGSERVTQVFGNRVEHCYLPYDLPWAVGRFLDRWRPAWGLILETELWPNLLFACQQRAVPLSLANARLSERSARGYQRIRSLTKPALNCLSWVGARHETDQQRFIALGLNADRVTVTGNIKFDFPMDDALIKSGQQLRSNIGPDRPVWIGASTHPGEEQLLLQVHQQLLEQHPDALLILAPRHPERRKEVLALCEKQGLETRSRTTQQTFEPSCQVFLLDTIGELLHFFVASDMAFIGGSLVEHGGHNPLEPAALGLPVVYGPHMFNFEEIANQLCEANAAIKVKDTTQLIAQLEAWISNPDAARTTGEKGQQLVAQNRGAVNQLLSLCRTFPVSGQ